MVTSKTHSKRQRYPSMFLFCKTVKNESPFLTKDVESACHNDIASSSFSSVSKFNQERIRSPRDPHGAVEYGCEVYGCEVYEHEVYDREVYDREVYEREVYEREVYEREVYERQVFKAQQSTDLNFNFSNQTTRPIRKKEFGPSRQMRGLSVNVINNVEKVQERIRKSEALQVRIKLPL